MSNELAVVNSNQITESQPDPDAKNVINYNPIFPILMAQINLDLPVTDMAEDLMSLANNTENYSGGFTTYYTNQYIDGVRGITDLKQAIYGVAAAYMKELKYDVNLEKCGIHLWANIMKKDGYHGHHRHERSVLSGTYYVQTFEDSSPLIIENPTSMFRMHEPIVAKPEDYTAFTSPMLSLQPKPNTLFMWPSWLVHHVPSSKSSLPRISLSFNVDYLPKGA
jgi:uncharacterized protein (TIGR02466 family)